MAMKMLRGMAFWLGFLFLAVALVFGLPGLWLTDWSHRWD